MRLICDNKECKVVHGDPGDFYVQQNGVHWVGERCIEFLMCNNCGQSVFPCPYCGATTKDALNDHVSAPLGVVLSGQPPIWSFNDKAV